MSLRPLLHSFIPKRIAVVRLPSWIKPQNQNLIIIKRGASAAASKRSDATRGGGKQKNSNDTAAERSSSGGQKAANTNSSEAKVFDATPNNTPGSANN